MIRIVYVQSHNQIGDVNGHVETRNFHSNEWANPTSEKFFCEKKHIVSSRGHLKFFSLHKDSEEKKRKNCCACLGAREQINLKFQICWIAFRELHEYWKYFPKKETSSFWKMQEKICLSPKDASYRICHYDYNTQNIIFFSYISTLFFLQLFSGICP